MVLSLGAMKSGWALTVPDSSPEWTLIFVFLIISQGESAIMYNCCLASSRHEL